MPNDAILLIYVLLFAFTSYFMFLYYRKTKEVSREYIGAKTVLDDIILSFNRDLQSQEERINEIADKSGKMSIEDARVIGEMNSELSNVKAQIEDLAKAKESFLSNYDDLRKKIEDLMSRYNEVFKKIGELESSDLERRIPETRVESAMQVRRERALMPLTETELKVLELLAAEGESTASKIKDGINLTREHTARLMKSLYIRGYVERKTEKMPFVYSLNKDMKGLLKRAKTEI